MVNESQLKEMIKESIKRHLNEGTSFQDSIDKWNTVKEQIGAEQMLECIYQWTNSDQIDQWLQWFEDEEWVNFDNNEEEY